MDRQRRRELLEATLVQAVGTVLGGSVLAVAAAFGGLLDPVDVWNGALSLVGGAGCGILGWTLSTARLQTRPEQRSRHQRLAIAGASLVAVGLLLKLVPITFP